MDDVIIHALKSYERDTAHKNKQAVLLLPEGGYYLYGNRFCSIRDYELELYGNSDVIQGHCVKSPLFLEVRENRLVTAGISKLVQVSLLFHIDLGEDNELLRGILFAQGQEARIILFMDEKLEEVYRLLWRTHLTVPTVPPDETLQQMAEVIRKNDLSCLTSLYLRGMKLEKLEIK